MENYQAAIAKGKGVLSIVAHFGNWELMTIAVPMFSKPMYIVYRPLDNPVIDNMVEYVRTMNGNELIPKGGSGKRIMELLKENQIIGILSDQNVATYEGVFVDFFGRPACTGVGLAVMAMRSGAPVIPAFMARQKSGKYKLILKPAVEAIRTDDYEADLVVNTQRFTKIVEEIVREYPDQWFWFHQRWKTKKWQKIDEVQEKSCTCDQLTPIFRRYLLCNFVSSIRATIAPIRHQNISVCVSQI